MTTISIEDALTDANLFDAWDKVRSNRGCAGIDGVTIEEFGRDLWPNLHLLRNEVRYGTYRPLPLLRMEIEKKSGGAAGRCRFRLFAIVCCRRRSPRRSRRCSRPSSRMPASPIARGAR